MEEKKKETNSYSLRPPRFSPLVLLASLAGLALVIWGVWYIRNGSDYFGVALSIFVSVLGITLGATFYYEKSANLRIKKAPGSTLLSIVDFFFSPTVIENVFKPIVADWRTEFFNALQKGWRWKAKWIQARYTVSFMMAMGLSKVFSFIKSLARK